MLLVKLLPRFFRQRKVEPSAIARLGLGPHSATISMNYSIDDGQTNPNAFKFANGMQALEGSEELLSMRWIEADSCIGNHVSRLSFCRGGACYADRCLGRAGRELPRICDEVFKDDGKQARIT